MNNQVGRTALFKAVERNEEDMVEFLIEKGASVNIPDKVGEEL